VVEELRSRLGGLALVDEQRLGRRLAGLRKIREPEARGRSLAAIEQAVDAAEATIERRRAAVPTITYPEHLPVSERRDEIAAAVRDHQVVVLAGETGSGKTTQLPKICLELGRGIRGRIGHTQPRRIAARSVAERLAEELDRPLGGVVGFQVRFNDQVGPETLVKVMTDGILLAEIQRDRDLRAYDTIILDEAHERSLTIDFLLGYLTQLLPRRPDLKLIITSATIELDRFAEHFGGAPVIEVSGRTYPVEVRYRPLGPEPKRTGDDRRLAGSEVVERDQVQGICDAVEELALEGPGDVLVFLSGEREIRDTADAIDGLGLRDTETLPLYGRLSAAEQHRVFSPHPGRRVVLSTNVAETSLTVPGIRYVVDAGTARISRYSNRTKVQRLPIEAVSQASAKQRAGRCGRVADGICIRLYSEVDHETRPAFTEPEIQRTSLASVILQMAALGLGAVERFPFLDAPDARQIRDGIALLSELGALEPPTAKDAGRGPRLTDVGRKIAGLPLDPRLARMVLAADANGCVREAIVIVAALSIQDPRERPLEHRAAAEASHARFAHEHSDFLGILNLWGYLRDQQKTLSSSAFRRMCKSEYLHWLRIREWQDVVAQLKQAASALGIAVSSAPMAHDAIHQSVLTGLLSQIGLRDRQRRDYLGARGVRFAINPGSVLFGKPPDWVMAAELVETTRLWARVCARIEPEWAEALAEPMLYRSYSEPRWSAKRGSVVAQEKVHLYGVPLVASRTVAYGRIDPELSRELFIRHALVDGEWQTRHQFFHDNRGLLDDVQELEHRARRRDIVVEDEALVEFYDQRVPAAVVSARHFDSWWKQARHETPDLLTFTRELVLAGDTKIDTDDYPAVWRSGDLELPLTYQFEPGTDADGVTVHVPVSVLGRVAPSGFGQQVPGLRLEMVIALIRSLPKAIRKNFVPVPDVARAVVEHLDPSSTEPLVDLLAWELHRSTGVAIPRDAWDLDRVPAHLRPTYRVEDASGGQLAEGKDLTALQAKLKVEVRRAVSRIGTDLERHDVRTWDLGTLPRVVDGEVDGHAVRGYPALVHEGDRVAVRVLASAAEQARAMQAGTRRLLTPDAPSASRLAANYLDNKAKLALGHNPHGGVPALLADVTAAALDAVVADTGGPAWDAVGFAALRGAVRQRAADELVPILRRVAGILAVSHDVQGSLRDLASPALATSVADLRAQLASLIHSGFVTGTGRDGLADLERYLRALAHRVQVLPADPARDRASLERVQVVQAEVDKTLRLLPAALAAGPHVDKINQMVQELRVSLFAQQIRTAYAISEQRIWRALDRMLDGSG